MQSKPFSGASEGAQSGSASEHHGPKSSSHLRLNGLAVSLRDCWACVATRSESRPWIYSAFKRPTMIQVPNMPASFPLLLGLPSKTSPSTSRAKYPLARLCAPARFGGMLLPVCLKDFPRFTTLTRRLFVREL